MKNEREINEEKDRVRIFENKWRATWSFFACHKG
jgi:hypothetical protein